MNRHRNAVPCLLVAVALAAALSARADDGSIENVGGHIEPMSENPSVAMTSEFVHAHVASDSVRVECVFFLANRGPATHMLVGFPCSSRGDVTEPTQFRWFRSWVDGTPVKARLVRDTSSSSDGGWFRSWWVKDVAFGAHQTRCIRDEYAAEPGGSVPDYQSFAYTLDTGASWHGPIGTADIVVSFEGLPPIRIEQVEPAATSRDRDELRWHFDRFEPGRVDAPAEVSVEWRPQHRDPPRPGAWNASELAPSAPDMHLVARFVGCTEGDYRYHLFCLDRDSTFIPDQIEESAEYFAVAHPRVPLDLTLQRLDVHRGNGDPAWELRAARLGALDSDTWWRGEVQRLGEDAAQATYSAREDSLTDNPRVPLTCR
jgi:hypothetical protein